VKYIVPSSKIVFTDLMILLVSVLIGINSTMTFNEERDLPPLDLPEISEAPQSGSDGVNSAVITIDKKAGQEQFYYENKKVSRKQMVKIIKKSKISSVVLRCSQKINFSWDEFVQLNSDLSNAGVKAVRYSIKSQ